MEGGTKVIIVKGEPKGQTGKYIGVLHDENGTRVIIDLGEYDIDLPKDYIEEY